MQWCDGKDCRSTTIGFFLIESRITVNTENIHVYIYEADKFID